MLRRYSFVILALSPWLAAPFVMSAHLPQRALVEALGRVDQLRSYTAFDWISGPHAIHIIANSGRILLRGEVRTRGDSQIAEATVRTLPGVLGVVNELRVATAE